MQQIDEYVVDKNKVIGQGEYGKVFECRKQGSDEALCKKMMMGTHRYYPQSEFDILNILKDKAQDNINIVKIHYLKFLQEEKTICIVMEKCTDNLKDVIKKRNGSFQSYEILEILKQILNGYQFLYNNSILHRDLQPGNILINYNNEGRPIYKLTDFGVGKIQKKNDFDMTKTGTPVYAAPEINTLNNDPNLIDEFKCLFSIIYLIIWIGMTLYLLVFNDFPFKTTAQGVTQFLKNQKNEQFTIPQNKHENKVPFFIKIIEQTLQYNPNERIKFQELHSQVSRYFLSYKQRNTNFQQNLQIIPQQNLFIFREDNILTIKEYLNLTYEI